MTEQPTSKYPKGVEGLQDALKQAKEDCIFKIPADSMKINLPKQSNWTCYMFGNRPDVNTGIAYTPAEGCVPNFFVRWMMRICFDCYWVKNK
jgi:hypothetical protein